MKIENIIDGVGPGPVFPKALAESIASHSRRQIHWRSAGVDGGDIQLINDFCFQVIEEEVANGRAPDVVVILCGANDLKYYVGNPLNGAGPKAFRSRLKGLIRKIKFVAPNCTIVLPSFPTQMFHRHSLLNIFPLNFFLDTVIGFWDSQKKLVADALPSEIIYFEMNPSEIFDWHTFEDGKDHNASTLISVDGVHPNAKVRYIILFFVNTYTIHLALTIFFVKKCYGLWANSLGKKIVETVNHPTATRCKKGISGV
jgi:lysophospholipase L1-like esterase